MAAILESALDRLRAAGLLVSEPFVSDHRAYPNGVTVCKPASVPGHSIAGYECYWGVDGPLIDAPGLWLHSDGVSWFVTCHEYIPGPGPGDFVNKWSTVDEAVTDILDFYFGSPARMHVKRAAHEEVDRQINKAVRDRRNT